MKTLLSTILIFFSILAGPATAADGPNFVVVDDMSYADLGCYSHPDFIKKLHAIAQKHKAGIEPVYNQLEKR